MPIYVSMPNLSCLGGAGDGGLGRSLPVYLSNEQSGRVPASG